MSKGRQTEWPFFPTYQGGDPVPEAPWWTCLSLSLVRIMSHTRPRVSFMELWERISPEYPDFIVIGLLHKEGSGGLGEM